MAGRSHTRGAVIVGLAVVGLAGCGGSRQDAHEPSGTFRVAVPAASFPARQHIAQSTRMTITVRNDDSRTIPNLAVTINSFNYIDKTPGLADPSRPIWVVDGEPRGGVTTYVDTWALGALAPGRSATFTWRVTPVRSGHFSVSYRIAAGLNGKAKAQLDGGGAPGGTFNVKVSSRPPTAQVNPDTGQVVDSAPSTATGAPQPAHPRVESPSKTTQQTTPSAGGGQPNPSGY